METPKMTDQEKADLLNWKSKTVYSAAEDQELARAVKREEELAIKEEEKRKQEEIEKGKIRIQRVIDPKDLKPDAYRTTPEEIALNPGDDDEAFEKRKDELTGSV